MKRTVYLITFPKPIWSKERFAFVKDVWSGRECTTIFESDYGIGMRKLYMLYKFYEGFFYSQQEKELWQNGYATSS